MVFGFGFLVPLVCGSGIRWHRFVAVLGSMVLVSFWGLVGLIVVGFVDPSSVVKLFLSLCSGCRQGALLASKCLTG